MSYTVWKFIHLVCVIVFLGNITTGLFWADHAHKTRDARLIASIFHGLTKSDRWFTIPSVIGIVVSGVKAALIGGLPILATGWILWPIILFSISGIVFGIWVAPLQRRIHRLMQEASSFEQARETYAALHRKFNLWGLVAIGTLVIATAIMAFKPSLPAP
ncbi:MAG: DUF2269 family protein [Acidobacteria bacterium]|nr:DUF2269 family protein [Acidobacteriota bacterium]